MRVFYFKILNIFLVLLLSCDSSKFPRLSYQDNPYETGDNASKNQDIAIKISWDDEIISQNNQIHNNLPLPLFLTPRPSWCEYDTQYCKTPIARPIRPPPKTVFKIYDHTFRSLNAQDNHENKWGRAPDDDLPILATGASSLIRLLSPKYLQDGNTPNTQNLPHPRLISNEIFDVDEITLNSHGLSHFLFFWGQFLDHDMVLTPVGDDESFPIIPLNGDSLAMNGVTFFRSEKLPGTGTSKENPRQQFNSNTSFIDASHIYGSTIDRAHWLRKGKNGLLKLTKERFLPFGSVDGSSPFMAGLHENPSLEGPSDLYVAGDIRANEVISLLTLHTIFVREHNRIAESISSVAKFSDNLTYHLARKVVAAIIQAITYNEFLPALGIDLPLYKNYDPEADPRITNLFATAAFRLGHVMVTDKIPLIDKNLNQSSLDLFSAFFAPSLLTESLMAQILRGGAKNLAKKINNKLVDGLRNFLFGPPGSDMGLDLAMLNIHRGRDHGLPSYISMRNLFDGQNKLEQDVQNELLTVYNHVSDIDVWVGILSEPHLPGKPIGQSIYDILRKQFISLRDGDRFFYKNDPALKDEGLLDMLGFGLDYIEKRKLSSIIIDNTKVKKAQIQKEVFFVP